MSKERVGWVDRSQLCCPSVVSRGLPWSRVVSHCLPWSSGSCVGRFQIIRPALISNCLPWSPVVSRCLPCFPAKWLA